MTITAQTIEVTTPTDVVAATAAQAVAAPATVEQITKGRTLSYTLQDYIDGKTLAPRDAEYVSEILAFSTRDEYMAWVSTWKSVHAVIVQDIREEKALRGDKTKPISERVEANLRRQGLRSTSSYLQLIRRTGKKRAGEQRERNASA